MLMKQRCGSSWQKPRMYRSAHEYLWCASHFTSCLQTEFFCLSKVFLTNLDAEQPGVQSNARNLNYSGARAILWSLSFSHPPPQRRGFNPVASVSGSSSSPAPKGIIPRGRGAETRGGTEHPGPAAASLGRARVSGHG